MNIEQPMKFGKVSVVAWVFVLCMLGMTAVAVVSRPTDMIADHAQPLALDAAIPVSFDDWHVDDKLPVVLPSPDVEAAVRQIYNQVVTRTYVNALGQHIMLSIAYGRNQSDAVAVHKPEGCYGGQGFSVSSVQVVPVQVMPGRTLPIRRMLAQRNDRVEPVSYWVLIGDTVSSSNWKEKLVQLKYGLQHKIPDGLLVRVSSIDMDSERAYGLQDQFIKKMLNHVDSNLRVRIVGGKSNF